MVYNYVQPIVCTVNNGEPMKLTRKANDVYAYTPIACRELPKEERIIIKMQPLMARKARELRDDMIKFDGKTGSVSSIGSSAHQYKCVKQQLESVQGLIEVPGPDGEYKVVYGDREKGAKSVTLLVGAEREKFLNTIPSDMLAELEAVFGQGSYSASGEANYIKLLESDKLKEDAEAAAESTDESEEG